MSLSPHRAVRTTAVVLGTAGLIALGSAPSAFADRNAPDLALGGIAPVGGVKPGSTFDRPVVVANNGTASADKVWVQYSVTRGLDYADVPSNCRTHAVPSYDEMTAKSNVVCAFDQELEPGRAYTPETPLAVKALGNALNDVLRVSVWDIDPPLDDAATPPVAGTAPAVQLVESHAGGEATEEAVDVPVSSVNTADWQVQGADLTGSVGDVVTLKVKFTNAGPAWVLTDEGDPVRQVLITPPAGTSVVKGDGFCDAEDGTYVCGTAQRWVDEGEGGLYTFQLKIDERVPGAKGSVALAPHERPFDPEKDNDKADITLDVKDSGSTGGTSHDGSGSGSGSGSAGGNQPGAQGGGELADTGASSTAVGTAAAAMIAAGGVLLVRRRRGTRAQV
ncbi:LPXTG cell wall anchor domain-containing protein [Streptomyces sp. NPDC059166]|uniref:LPXTG cell wall anchor domain-containing protein n=1 Tax=Streptomyces sp. NPDC059166 TaxID=3346752 RepID=UPI0036984DE3